MPSGKQVLIHLIEKHSQNESSEQDLHEISENFRIALLLHGSTSTDMWFNFERLAWHSKTDESGTLRQGLGLRGKEIFLLDIFEDIFHNDRILEAINSELSHLTEDELEDSVHTILLLLWATEFCSQLNQVENGGVLDHNQLKKWYKSYREKLANFRLDPGEFLGCTDETYKKICRDKLFEIHQGKNIEPPQTDPTISVEGEGININSIPVTQNSTDQTSNNLSDDTKAQCEKLSRMHRHSLQLLEASKEINNTEIYHSAQALTQCLQNHLIEYENTLKTSDLLTPKDTQT